MGRQPELDRRTFLAAAAIGGASTAASAKPAARSAARVTGLRTAQLDCPLGLEDAAPSLSWRIDGARRGIEQTAYRIRVASSAEALAAGRGDLWDSGRVASAQSVGVRYAGSPLVSRQRCFWTVTVWDETGSALPPGEASWWETGLLKPDDWQAKWLAAENAESRDDRLAGMTWVSAPISAKDERRLFRLEFMVPAAGRGRLLVATDGLLSALTLDGAVLPLPAHDPKAFGGPPAAHVPLALKAGRHVIVAEVTPKRGFRPQTKVALVGQLRLAEASGALWRLSEGWQTATTAAPNDWSSAHIADPQPFVPWPPTAATLLRRAFKASKPVRSARLYCAALGSYEVRLNGRKVGDDLLAGESVKFGKRILYRVHDVTGLVVPGENALGAIVGDGWYASYQAPVGRYAYGPAPRRVLLQLELTYADGSRETVGTGDGWHVHDAPILTSEIYNGEVYDARLEQPGWDRPGFHAAGWTPSWEAPPARGALVAQVSPPIRVTRTLQPIAVTQPIPGVHIFDFGQNFAGLPRLQVRGPAGTGVELRFAELLSADGNIDQSNLRAAKATDVYILRGDRGGETYVPRFTYHGFRYIAMSGYPGTPGPDALTALAISSDLPETGLFRIDSPVVQKLWTNTLWSQRSNFVGIPTDCPQRDERLGWAGDAQVFWDAAAFNMDVTAFTRRFTGDLRDDQMPSGAFPIYAPAAGETPSGAPSATPAWSDAGIVLPWTAYRNSGDASVLSDNWDAMTHYVAGILADNPDSLWRNGRGIDFGDWLSLDGKTPGDPTTPKDLVGTAMLARNLSMLADIGAVLGRTQEAAGYRATLAHVRAAFNDAFVRPDGTVGNGSHTGYILAIANDLLQPTVRAAAGAKLAADIRRRGTLLSTGFVGTPVSLDALAAIGENELLYDLLFRTDYPSWGYMVRKGATTIWERWNGDTGDVAMNSYNHYALGAISGFLYRRVAGIDAAEPGFARIRVRPVLDPRVKRWGGRYDSVRGRITTEWRRDHGSLALDLTVPANSRAEIHLPAVAPGDVTESGMSLETHRDIRILDRKPGLLIAETGSGTYRFTTTLR